MKMRRVTAGVTGAEEKKQKNKQKRTRILYKNVAYLLCPSLETVLSAFCSAADGHQTRSAKTRKAKFIRRLQVLMMSASSVVGSQPAEQCEMSSGPTEARPIKTPTHTGERRRCVSGEGQSS